MRYLSVYAKLTKETVVSWMCFPILDMRFFVCLFGFNVAFKHLRSYLDCVYS